MTGYIKIQFSPQSQLPSKQRWYPVRIFEVVGISILNNNYKNA
jgi:hypothetical protein